MAAAMSPRHLCDFLALVAWHLEQAADALPLVLVLL